ncbi:hypothetical protein AAFF_G00258170 [Aldrovandia affinis]|uniref:Uncharacterized protein n=1 Tax=Aldrovandia affinis TaxID=143900 RepID=A0AAD7WTE9_9TELE|nr:hypothetical protein AAFF_G00258170 [Aldrovandia affinis]
MSSPTAQEQQRSPLRQRSPNRSVTPGPSIRLDWRDLSARRRPGHTPPSEGTAPVQELSARHLKAPASEGTSPRSVVLRDRTGGSQRTATKKSAHVNRRS